jgi:hypothetical protein
MMNHADVNKLDTGFIRLDRHELAADCAFAFHQLVIRL